MPRSAKTIILALIVLVGAAGSVLAFDPPLGGDYLPWLWAPESAALGLTLTSDSGPDASAANPAAEAGEQRNGFSVDYGLILGLGSSSGTGHTASLAFTLPQAYGVWGGGLAFAYAPFESLPLGAYFTARGTFAKDLYPNLFIGASIDASLAFVADSSPDWGLWADLGMVHRPGDLGFLKDFGWGLVFSGLGKWTDPYVSETITAYPSPFTLKAGARGYLVEGEDFRLAALAGLAFPSFQDIQFSAGLDASYRGLVGLRLGWSLDLGDALAGQEDYLPSFGLYGTIPLGDSGGERGEWARTEIIPSLSATPLYDGIWAFTTGVSMPLGVLDRNPPKVTLSCPESKYEAYYISPNNDGVLDGIVLPLAIADERYVASWTMRILDDKGQVVRTIGNKESRPETEGFTGLLDRLLYVKKGVTVPAELVWNGVADSGDVAPDGRYTVVVEAVDDNGNKGLSESYPIVVDRAPPEAKAAGPEEGLIFSPDGDGNKDSLLIRQSGTVEDLWVATVLDAAGAVARKLSYASAAPVDFAWDGRDDSGRLVPDGIYSFALSAVDRAGNAVLRKVENIVVNTQQPPVNVAIDIAAFSPNGDGVRDAVTLIPSVPIRTGVASWRLSVVDRDRRAVWSVEGRDGASIPERLRFEGLGADGKRIAEGSYQALLELSYVNGHAPLSLSPAFIADLAAPEARVSADKAVFNPAGSGVQAEVVFSMSASKEEAWTGEVLDDKGRVVKAYAFVGMPPASVSWDGRDDAGRIAPDGAYQFRLRSQDRAGNAGASNYALVRVDTEKKAVTLSVGRRAFSPNGDGAADVQRIVPSVASTDAPVSWTVEVLDASGKAVKAWTGAGQVPAEIPWQGLDEAGKPVPDGRYEARLAVSFANGNKEGAGSPAFTLDTVAPSATLSVSLALFSPNGDGKKDSTAFSQSSVPGDDWTGRILDAGGKAIRSYAWSGALEPFTWDGTDEAGNRVPDGIYRYVVSSVDAAGNAAERSIQGLTVDTRPVSLFLTASRPGFSPNGDGQADDLRIGIIAGLKDGMESWRLDIVDQGGAVRRSFSGKGPDSLPHEIAWDGKDEKGVTTSSIYYATITAVFSRGDEPQARSATFALDVDGPAVGVRTSPALFSPDNDGVDDELTIFLEVRDASQVAEWRLEIDEQAAVDTAGAAPKDRIFVVWGGKGTPAERIVWDGRSQKGELVESATDYPYSLVVTDIYGNSTRVTGEIAVDVLVIRQGDQLMIKVPAIVFRPNQADFNGLPQEVVEKNLWVIKRIAQILNRFKDYRIMILGHANNEGKIASLPEAAIALEEEKEVLPLSRIRAQAVMAFLAENGVDPRRLTTDGAGSSQPVVDCKDAENRWKNRRVEFILIKN